MYSLTDYHYELPDALIAQEAIHPHHNARLMVIDRATGELIAQDIFWNLDQYIPADRVLFFNNSRVLPARIRLKDASIQKNDGSRGLISDGEILFCQKQSNGTFEALVRPGKKYTPGTKIYFSDTTYLEVIGMSESGRYLRAYGLSIEAIMATYGELPLPPYITYDKSKEKDYQTVFAKHDGSVAAPTASLHFTSELLERLTLQKEYITLHVWLGTFKWVDTNDIREYSIHGEMISIDSWLFSRIHTLREEQQKILAIGTTVARTLESLPYLWKAFDADIKEGFDSSVREYWDSLTSDIWDDMYISEVIHDAHSHTIHFQTKIYIYPWKKFLLVDELITNFHLPESSLLMLVSTFLGYENTLTIYKKAVEEKYRFFSFGDGMYIRDMREK